MRCKCCNVIMSGERSARRRKNGKLEDLCTSCINLAFDTYPEHEYHHSKLTEDDVTILISKLDGELA